MPFEVRKVEIKSVNDASGLAELIDDGVFAADEVDRRHRQDRGQRRGQRLHPDPRRPGLPRRAARQGHAREDEVKQIPMAWSGRLRRGHHPARDRVRAGRRRPGVDTDDKRLSVGFAMSDVLLPEDIGRPAMVEKVAEGVKRAMAEAGITDVADVHYVQTKTPLLVQETIADAHARGETVYTEDTLYSMDISNGTTGLGIAYALGEIDEVPPADEICTTPTCTRRSRRARRASSSTGPRSWWSATPPAPGRAYRVGHSEMKDALDQDGIWDAIRSPGSTCRSARTTPTSATGSSTCSSSARPTRAGRCAAGGS
jgi:barbiturase